MQKRGAIWAFLLTMFMAVAAAVAILPGCGGDDGDGGNGESDTSGFSDNISELR